MGNDSSSSLIVGLSEQDAPELFVEDEDELGFELIGDLDEHFNGCLATGRGLTKFIGIYLAYGGMYEGVEVSEADISKTMKKAKEDFTAMGIDINPKLYLLTTYS